MVQWSIWSAGASGLMPGSVISNTYEHWARFHENTLSFIFSTFILFFTEITTSLLHDFRKKRSFNSNKGIGYFRVTVTILYD